MARLIRRSCTRIETPKNASVISGVGITYLRVCENAIVLNNELPGSRPRLKRGLVSLVGGLGFLFARGFLLWIAIPLAALGWLGAYPVWRHRGVALGQLMGWADLNLIAALQSTLFRPFFEVTRDFIPLREAGSVDHRVGLADPV